MKRMTYSRNPRRATNPLEKLSADICTINEVSADKSTMFLLVMDEFSRYKWAYLLKSKADASDHPEAGEEVQATQCDAVHADGGGEFISNDFTAFCVNQGVELNYTHPDSPDENGIVERNNGIIVSRVRSMLDAPRLPNSLWREALLHAVDTLNVCPTSALQGRSSHEVLYGSLPSLRSLRTWGCMTHLVLNTFFHGDFQLSRDIPVVRIKSSMDTYIKDDRASQIEIVEETTATATGNAPAAEPAPSSPASTDMRVGTKRKRSDEQAELLRAAKRDERGRIKRYKARLVIHGFKQLAGLEYTETYAPVIRFETIRAAIYFALQRGWAIVQYDVKTAFLYGHLDEVIFMEQPPGFQSEPDAYVCHLQRSLYGLRQAPNVWNRTLHKALERLGFSRLDSDYGLYAQKMGEIGGVSMLLTVYVDDILLLGPTDLCRSVAQQLAEEFELTALGPVKYLLGAEILIDPLHKEVVYCQRQHVNDILKRFNMESCNGCTTPEATTPQQLRAPVDKSYLPYRELVGALQYLVSASRPDIAHGVRNLGKYLSNYTYEHYFMAKRVLRYLASTVDYGLVNTIRTGSRVTVTCFTDADYANDVDNRKSISGYVTMLDGNVVSYASRKQEINAQSTTEAEYVAMNEGTKDLLWMSGLCLELNWEVEGPVLYGDNRGKDEAY
ncbi:hypothetical protein PR003_g26725 [Phytophthora rubi]|uniref:Integrase catalytic domain-containing protein n=1 Tax=Phytophthora rubi TaxID=129364 RepID=A0A6A4C535_9STRA|nr:hypothetical protein PR003_g26725 [Phytophthora rubi]